MCYNESTGILTASTKEIAEKTKEFQSRESSMTEISVSRTRFLFIARDRFVNKNFIGCQKFDFTISILRYQSWFLVSEEAVHSSLNPLSKIG